MKNRCFPIVKPSRYAYKISSSRFGGVLATNTATRKCYILDVSKDISSILAA